jgi:hypothetical protein
MAAGNEVAAQNADAQVGESNTYQRPERTGVLRPTVLQHHSQRDVRESSDWPLPPAHALWSDESGSCEGDTLPVVRSSRSFCGLD